MLHLLVVTGFSLILYALWLRLSLQYILINPENPIFSRLCWWTNGLRYPWSLLLRKKWRLDGATLMSLVILDGIKFYVLNGMIHHAPLPLTVAVVLVLGDAFILSVQGLFYAFMLRIAMPWIPRFNTPALRQMVVGLTDPLMSWSREWIAPMGRYDFLPLVWLFILKMMSFFVYISMPLHLM